MKIKNYATADRIIDAITDYRERVRNPKAMPNYLYLGIQEYKDLGFSRSDKNIFFFGIYVKFKYCNSFLALE